MQFVLPVFRLFASLRIYFANTWTDEVLVSFLVSTALVLLLVWSTVYEKRMFTKEDSKSSRKRFERIYLPSECVLEPTLQGKGKGPNYFSFFSQSNKAAEVILAPENLPATSTPLLCFVNSRSGANQGKLVLAILKNLLHPAQVVDLAKNDPVKVLQTFSVLPGLRILVAGGDGTVGWILNAVEKINNLAEHTPPVAVLPLGTGNDLARVLGWGVSVDVDELPSFLDNIQHASTIYLDWWEMIAYTDKKVEQRRVSFSNYLGIGVDASIIMRFHDARESAPHRFVSQIINKVWYGVMGGLEIFWRKCKGISKHIQLSADGKPIALPEEMEGIIFSNIPSYGGGIHFWHEEDDSDEDEVVAERKASDEVSTPARRRSTRAANRAVGETNTTTKPLAKIKSPIPRTISRAWYPESVQDGVLEVSIPLHIHAHTNLSLSTILVLFTSTTRFTHFSRS